MILDGVCYPFIHFCWVILYVWFSPSVSSLSVCLSLASTLVRVPSPLDVYRGFCVFPSCSAVNNTFFTIHHLFEPLDLLSGEGVLTH